MGCDIHEHIEVKVNGKWEHYSIPNLQRNYRLFAKAANVRNSFDIEPISEPRGLPKDMSIVTRKSAESWGRDAHSHSWLNYSELAELLDFHTQLIVKDGKDIFELYDQWGYLEGNSFSGFSKYPGARPKWIEDVRLVFWFDN